jgi:hypothetical protein
MEEFLFFTPGLCIIAYPNLFGNEGFVVVVVVLLAYAS